MDKHMGLLISADNGCSVLTIAKWLWKSLLFSVCLQAYPLAGFCTNLSLSWFPLICVYTCVISNLPFSHNRHALKGVLGVFLGGNPPMLGGDRGEDPEHYLFQIIKYI